MPWYIYIYIYILYIYIYDDDDDDFVLFQVHLLDNYKDRSPGLHMWTLPPLVPTSIPWFITKTTEKKKKRKKTDHTGPSCYPPL